LDVCSYLGEVAMLQKNKTKIKEKLFIVHMWDWEWECRFHSIVKAVKLHTKFMVSLTNEIYTCIFFHLWEPNNEDIFIHSSMRKNRKKKSGRNKKCWKELTPRMQYQSMKVVFVGFERILWTQDAERVEMEQISITNLDLESDSCPIWEFDMKYDYD
jgi:hypothetical protein